MEPKPPEGSAKKTGQHTTPEGIEEFYNEDGVLEMRVLPNGNTEHWSRNGKILQVTDREGNNLPIDAPAPQPEPPLNPVDNGENQTEDRKEERKAEIRRLKEIIASREELIKENNRREKEILKRLAEIGAENAETPKQARERARAEQILRIEEGLKRMNESDTQTKEDLRTATEALSVATGDDIARINQNIENAKIALRENEITRKAFLAEFPEIKVEQPPEIQPTPTERPETPPEPTRETPPETEQPKPPVETPPIAQNEAERKAYEKIRDDDLELQTINTALKHAKKELEDTGRFRFFKRHDLRKEILRLNQLRLDRETELLVGEEIGDRLKKASIEEQEGQQKNIENPAQGGKETKPKNESGGISEEERVAKMSPEDRKIWEYWNRR